MGVNVELESLLEHHPGYQELREGIAGHSIPGDGD